MQEDNKSLKLSLSKVEGERKQAQERSNTLEKVYNQFQYYLRRVFACASPSSEVVFLQYA